MRPCIHKRLLLPTAFTAVFSFRVLAGEPFSLPPPHTTEGYVVRLILNEVPFPGEWGFRSEADTMASMEQMLLVLHNRLHGVPPPYLQRHVAAVTTDDIVDIITAGGVRGQFDGFYRNADGVPSAVPRVEKRLDNLTRIANRGEPGRFHRMLTHGVTLVTVYIQDGDLPRDRHASMVIVQGEAATGGGFGWMQDMARFHPGGNFLRLADNQHGSLGGNRFFTLRRVPR